MQTSHRMIVVFERDAKGVAYVPRHVAVECWEYRTPMTVVAVEIYVGLVGVGMPGGLLVADSGSSAKYCKILS